MTIEFTDRYEAMGIPLPDTETMCLGECEGTGVIPVFCDDFITKKDGNLYSESEQNSILRELWLELEKEEHADDGYHFVVCPDCKGTRKR